MEDILGTQWFEEIFLKHCGDARPQLLIWDSHRSHESLESLTKARENNIIIFAFPPHTTHILCPLDRSVFGPFQSGYNRVCSDFLSSSPQNIISKNSVCQFLNLAFKQGFTRSNIVSDFEATGLVPWNPLAIKRSAFVPAAAFDTSAQIRSADDHPLSSVIMSVRSVCGDSHATTSASVISPLVKNAIYPTSPNSAIPQSPH